MPPKLSKINIEELSEAILDSKIIDSLAKALSPLIILSIDECLNKRLSALSGQLDDLKRNNATLNTRTEELKLENATLRKQLCEHTTRLDDLEAYSRADNLIIKRLPEQSYAERATASGGRDISDGYVNCRDSPGSGVYGH